MEQIKDVGNLGVNIFFGVLLGIIVLNLLALIFYCCCNKGCQCMRFLAHISWCIMAFIMLLTFLLGGVLGSVGLVMTDGSGFISYLFSKQNLLTDKVILTGQVATYLNPCFNGN